MICKICGNEVTEEMLSKSLGELSGRFACQRSLCVNCYINSIEIFSDNAKVLARVAHETMQLRSDVNDSLEMNRSQSKEYFKSLLGVLSEIRNLHEEVEDVKKEIRDLTELLAPTESQHNIPYIRACVHKRFKSVTA